MHRRYLYIFTIFLIVTISGEYLIYLSLNSLGIFALEYLKYIFFTLGIVLPSLFVGAMFYGEKNFSKLNSYLYTTGAVWLGFINYLVIVAVLVSLIIIINNTFNYNLPIKLISIILSSLAIGMTSFGIVNANKPKVVRVVVTSPELSPLWKDKKIVITSDTHIGLIRREKFLKKIIDIINKENPDITFNLGDLIDGPSLPYKKVFSPFLELKSKLGNFYVEGNHESYTLEYKKFKSEFPKNLIDVTNKKVIINNTQIIGLPFHEKTNAAQMKYELDLVSYDVTIPSIILMHDPKNTPILARYGASLVLSGHTHGGQFFPFTTLLRMVTGKYVYGLNYTSSTASITSSGVGTAMTPIRIGTNPEIVVITIK